MLVCPGCKGEMVCRSVNVLECPVCKQMANIVDGVITFDIQSEMSPRPAFYNHDDYKKGLEIHKLHETGYNENSRQGKMEGYFKAQLI